jgi:farnesyl diphosphate synthase
MAKFTTLKEFESVFPKLVEDILGYAKQYNLPEDFVTWFKKVPLRTNCALQPADL